MNDDWSLKDKRKLFKSLRNWSCDAACGLYKFDEDRKELIIPDEEKHFTPKEIIELDDYDIKVLIKKHKWYYIDGDDVEILRQKLIDDLQLRGGEVSPVSNRVVEEDYNLWIESVVNKRFGVK